MGCDNKFKKQNHVWFRAIHCSLTKVEECHGMLSHNAISLVPHDFGLIIVLSNSLTNIKTWFTHLMGKTINFDQVLTIESWPDVDTKGH